MASSPQQTGEFSFSLRTMFVVVTIVACTIQAMTVYGPIVGIVTAILLVGFWLRLRGPRTIFIVPRWIYLIGAAFMAIVAVFSFVIFVQTIDPIQGLTLAIAACGLSYAYRAWRNADVDLRAIPFSLGRMLRNVIHRRS